ncbi:MAG: hypothetical protein WC284_14690 [Candidimonas sp.]
MDNQFENYYTEIDEKVLNIFKSTMSYSVLSTWNIDMSMEENIQEVGKIRIYDNRTHIYSDVISTENHVPTWIIEKVDWGKCEIGMLCHTHEEATLVSMIYLERN